MQHRQLKEISCLFPLGVISVLVLAFLSNDLYLPCMPGLLKVFDTTNNVMQLSITAWFFGGMLLQLILGPVSDSYGRKPVMLVSILILVVASWVCASSHVIELFLLGRFLQGSATSGIMVVAFASIHEVYEEHGKGTKMLGLIGMGSAIAPIMGPVVGGYLCFLFDWQINFYVISGGGILIGIILSIVMPETSINKSSKFEIVAALKKYKNLISDNIYLFSVLAYAFLFFSGGAFLTGISFIFNDLLGISGKNIGFGISPMLLSYMLAASFSGKIEGQVGTNNLLKYGFTFVVMAMFIFIALSFLHINRLWFVVLPMLSFYFVLGLIGPVLNNISLTRSPTEAKGAASALLTFMMMLGSTLGSLLASIFYNGTLFVFSIVIAVPVFFAFACFVRYQRCSVQ